MTRCRLVMHGLRPGTRNTSLGRQALGHRSCSCFGCTSFGTEFYLRAERERGRLFLILGPEQEDDLPLQSKLHALQSTHVLYFKIVMMTKLLNPFTQTRYAASQRVTSSHTIETPSSTRELLVLQNSTRSQATFGGSLFRSPSAGCPRHISRTRNDHAKAGPCSYTLASPPTPRCSHDKEMWVR